MFVTWFVPKSTVVLKLTPLAADEIVNAPVLVVIVPELELI